MALRKSRSVVSVIMPARNVQDYIGESIRSVLSQRGVSFELLIFEDASTDKTSERITAYQKDPRVRVWRSRKKTGAAGAGNFLMARARGRYLAFCDADDKLRPGFLRIFSKVLDRNPGLGGVYGDRLIYERAGKSSRLYSDNRPPGKWDLIEGAISNGGAMIRRSLIRKTGGFRLDLPYLEDCELFLRLAEAAPFLYFKGKPLYVYRRTPGSLTVKFEKKRRDFYLKILRRTILRRHGVKVSW